jgi:hypothetical protein
VASLLFGFSAYRSFILNDVFILLAPSPNIHNSTPRMNTNNPDSAQQDDDPQPHQTKMESLDELNLVEINEPVDD